MWNDRMEGEGEWLTPQWDRVHSSYHQRRCWWLGGRPQNSLDRRRGEGHGRHTRARCGPDTPRPDGICCILDRHSWSVDWTSAVMGQERSLCPPSPIEHLPPGPTFECHFGAALCILKEHSSAWRFRCSALPPAFGATQFHPSFGRKHTEIASPDTDRRLQGVGRGAWGVRVQQALCLHWRNSPAQGDSLSCRWGGTWENERPSADAAIFSGSLSWSALTPRSATWWSDAQDTASRWHPSSGPPAVEVCTPTHSDRFVVICMGDARHQHLRRGIFVRWDAAIGACHVVYTEEGQVQARAQVLALDMGRVESWECKNTRLLQKPVEFTLVMQPLQALESLAHHPAEEWVIQPYFGVLFHVVTELPSEAYSIVMRMVRARSSTKG